MGKSRGYSLKNIDLQNYCKAKASSMPVHFKNTVEVANVLRGKTIKRANAYLKNVIAKKECVPFKKFKGGVGRCAQAKQFKVTQGRWPRKSARFLLDLLRNAVSNAEYKGMDTDRLHILHIKVNSAPLNRRRTFRAHGHITPYMSHQSHLEVVLAEKE
ncbi:60S ribosomal protein L17-like [Agrilus planipennis]|uniref:Large ribosomal subunit protein uL22 n=1 Tax=Agrilus planipennis TaxID=224129 RepID=A0A1W4WR02_AGRPL|nr:60S ribosomal protein L17-like [Agrilus planipennis]